MVGGRYINPFVEIRGIAHKPAVVDAERILINRHPTIRGRRADDVRLLAKDA